MGHVLIIPIGSSGNLLSVERAIMELGYKVLYYSTDIDLKSIDSVILPGVGTFINSMNFIRSDLEKIKQIIKSKPTLGICLGMHILATLGFEGGKALGLDLISGEVKKIVTDSPLPHIGWTNLSIIKESRILQGITSKDRFYFMHSYEFSNYTDIVALSNYSGHQFISVLEKDNIFAVQFHPEKSGNSGLKLLRNFLSIGAKDDVI